MSEGLASLEDKQVVVLAGGLATRLRGLDGDLPKALRPVGGRPFIDVMLDPLLEQEFRRFHFCLGSRGDQIVRHLANLGTELRVSVEVELVPQGTAGALVRSTGRLDDVFLVVMGDTYFEFDYGSLFDSLPDSADGLLVVTSADSGVTPNVSLSGDLITEYDKAGVSAGWTDTGVAVLRRRSLRLLERTEPPVDLTTLFVRLIEREALHARPTDRRFHDIGTPERYLRLDAHLGAGVQRGASG